MDFSSKVALVTGGAGGIGQAVCRAFAQAGARVAVVDRDEAAAAEVATALTNAGAQAIAITADVSRAEDVRAYVARTLDAFGAIDCFFNNAGIEGRVAFTADYEDDVFDAVIGVNLRG